MKTQFRLDDVAPAAILYHENSKLNSATLAAMAEAVGAFTEDTEQVRLSTTSHKTYPGNSRIPFPPRAEMHLLPRSLAQVLASRRSHGGNSKIYFHQVAALLDFACGVTGSHGNLKTDGFVQRLRAYPSGGALFPVEVYLGAFSIAGLEPGLYHHHPLDRCLETIRLENLKEEFSRLILVPSGSVENHGILVLAARWRLSFTKYRERGYRIVMLEAGHIAQNLQLSATALGLSACPIAGFLDDELAHQFGLSIAEEPPLYVLGV